MAFSFERSTSLQMVLVGLLAALLVACAAEVEVAPIDPRVDPERAVNDLRAELDAARGENIHLFSPTWYERAVSSYETAQRGLKQGEANSAILEASARGQAELAEARKYAATGADKLRSVFEARQAAATAGATTLYDREYEKLNERFLQLGRAVENDDVSAAVRDGKDVERGFRDLELRAIKETMLGEAERLLVEAEDRGAGRYAPVSLKNARDMLVATDRFITQNRYSPEVQPRAEEVLRQAQHVQVVMKQVRDWSKLTGEQQVLAVEERVVEIDSLVSGEESSRRVRPIPEYFDSVREGVKTSQDAQRFLNEEVQNLHAELATAQEELQRLGKVQQAHEQERAFQAKFTRVRNQFDPNEADVYRQGDDLLIRLKALNFDIGKAYLLPEHYPLLAKVQKAIRVFDAKYVWIEGHTDSTGSALTNQALSQRRAEAVVAYLVNSGTITAEQINAVGYGPEKPIAPNTTADGRRLNRRIDVILVAR